MVFLLGDTQYGTLYNTPIRQLLPGMKPAVDAATTVYDGHTNGAIRKTLLLPSEAARINAGIDSIVSYLNDTKNTSIADVTLKEFFTNPKILKDHSALRDEFSLIRGNGIELPFLGAFDKQSAKDLFDPSKGDFLGKVGNLTEKDLYTRSKDSTDTEVVKAIEEALACGVLRYVSPFAPSGENRLMSGDNGSNKPNGCCCCPTTPLCRHVAPSSNTFCSLINGQCSLASDPCPTPCPTQQCSS
jgi:hypothetical protein